VSAAQVATSLALLVLVYGVIFVAGLWFLIRLLARGPTVVPPPGGPGRERTPMRPISAAGEAP
jgi:cytochrome d ubiquinol oxidase subunit I